MQREVENMSKRRITAMIDQADISRLEEIAQRQRVSLAWVIRDAVTEYLAGEAKEHGYSPEAGQEARAN